MSVPKAGGLGKASDWTTVFPLDTDAWTTYTPTLTQSATVTKTVNYARYFKIGRLVVCQGRLDVTSAGTANNAVAVGLPVTAATSSFLIGWGSFYVQDASASAQYPGFASPLSATTFGGLATGSGVYMGQTGSAFAAALASGDFIGWSIMFESAS